MLHALCENCRKTVQEVHEGEQVQDALTLVRGEEKTPRHVEWALEEIRTQSKGLDNYSEGIWVWSSHSNYEWLVIDIHGTIRCFDHIEAAVRCADGLYWGSDIWHNAPAFLIYKDMAWNANEIHVLHKAIKEREQ